MASSASTSTEELIRIMAGKYPHYGNETSLHYSAASAVASNG